VIDAITGGSSKPVELGPEDDLFFALLATDHGKGPARMLAAYPSMFGRRVMARVLVFRNDGFPDLCWVVEERPPTPCGPDTTIIRGNVKASSTTAQKASIERCSCGRG